MTLTLTAVDVPNGPGIMKITYSATGAQTIGSTSVFSDTVTVSITVEGVTRFTFFATNQDDVAESPQSLDVMLDKTAPIVTYTGNAGTYRILDTINITCSATDDLSGLISDTCQDITEPAYGFNPGTNAFSATATDLAFNVGTGSTSFVVWTTYNDLCALSQQFVTNAGVAQSSAMCAQLKTAERAAARNNLTAKRQAIAAYKSNVDAAVRGRYLTAARGLILKKWADSL